MKKIHFTDRYLLNPRHPVTVFVIGAGGTGSQVITNLARMSMALQALGHPGLHVTVFDPDTVSQANIGRQLFSETELGLNKAVSLVTRINRFFGYAWTTTLLPLLCIVMLPAWLLLAGKPMMMVNRPKQQPPHDNV